MSNLNIKEIRKDFPIIEGMDIAYLDNSATSQRPKCVMDAEVEFYEKYNANPFRGLYQLSIDATDRYEEGRTAVKDFINANSEKEIIFTRNTSESLNLLAYSLGEMVLKPGDEIITTVMEHHSNMLPWRLAAKRYGAQVKYLECNESGLVTPKDLEKIISDKTKIVAITHMSNIFGNLLDAEGLARVCHEHNAYFVVDGAQSVPHTKVDVKDLDIDFLAFSAHKMLGPMGIGVLYGKEKILEKMPPFLSGGEMIDTVTLDEITYAQLPHKFEAGTVNAAGAHALKAAIEYINNLGFENIEAREDMLCQMALDEIEKIPHVLVLGGKTAKEHHGIITFKIEGVHPHDIAAILADDGVAIRAGHHCAEPLHHFIGVPSTTRASLMFYNTEEEVERLVKSISGVRRKMGYAE